VSLIIGVTGGIASGKTTVTTIFHDHFGIHVIDADLIAREVVSVGTHGLDEIRHHFGDQIINSSGSLNRSELRHIIFSNPKEKEWLDNMLHPMIKSKIQLNLNHVISPYCLLVIPLLVENRWQSLTNKILVIDVDEETQIQRTMNRDNSNRIQAEQILSSQASRQQRLAIADDVIENNITYGQLSTKIARLHQKYLAIIEKNR